MHYEVAIEVTCSHERPMGKNRGYVPGEPKNRGYVPGAKSANRQNRGYVPDRIFANTYEE